MSNCQLTAKTFFLVVKKNRKIILSSRGKKDRMDGGDGFERWRGGGTGRIWKGKERKEGLEGLISRGRKEGNERKI